MDASLEEIRLRRWLRLIEWACPRDSRSSLVRAAGNAARAALAGDEPPEGPIHQDERG